MEDILKEEGLKEGRRLEGVLEVAAGARNLHTAEKLSIFSRLAVNFGSTMSVISSGHKT
jgi:hypothetical protein